MMIMITMIMLIIIMIIIKTVAVTVAVKSSSRCYNGFIVIVIMSVILWLLCLSLLTREEFNHYHGRKNILNQSFFLMNIDDSQLRTVRS